PGGARPHQIPDPGRARAAAGRGHADGARRRGRPHRRRGRRGCDQRVRGPREGARVTELIGEGPVLLSLDDGIARLRLNRPEASNGLSEALLEALVQATELAETTDGIRCLLLSGEGANFCAGGDVKEFAAKGAGLPKHLERQTALLQRATASLIRLRAPVV